MNESFQFEDAKDEAKAAGKDSRTRYILAAVVALWLATLATLLWVAWSAYFDEKDKSQTLAQQIKAACELGDLGRGLNPEDLNAGLSAEDEKALCDNAEKVIDYNDPERQDQEVQEAEIQEAEIQESEIQERERQEREKADAELQESETQNAELQESENQNDEIQDSEIQDPENQDPENQDPEIDDPDPNDQIEGGSCTFDGRGTFELTFQTSSGPVTVTCTGTQGPDVP